MIRGGKIIGEGGQGCIISPSWTHKGKEGEKYVTKIAPDYTTVKETEISDVLHKLDPIFKFGIYSIGKPVCGKITTSMWKHELKESKKWTRCKELSERNQDQICYVNYHKYISDLDHSLPTVITNNIKKECILNLWKGLTFFHSHNIIHGDIKGGNIALVKSGRNYSFVYADWGWSSNLDTYKNAKETYLSFLEAAPGYTVDVNGIWSKKVFSNQNISTLEQIRELLKFNDVFSLALFTYDLTLYDNDKRLSSFCNNIVVTEPLNLTAQAVLTVVSKILN